MKIFKYFNDQQSFSQIDIFLILRQQIKTILNMSPKNYEFMTFGREWIGLFTPIEQLNCQCLLDLMLRSTSQIQL